MSYLNPHNPGGALPFETLLDFVEERLTPAERRQVEAHLEENPTDRQAVEGIRLFLSQEVGGQQELLQYLDEQDHNFDHVLIRHRRNRFAKAGKWAVAASVLLGVVMLGLLLPRKESAPVLADKTSQSPVPHYQPETAQVVISEGQTDATLYREDKLPVFSELSYTEPTKDLAPRDSQFEEVHTDPLTKPAPPVLQDFLANPVPERIEQVAKAPVRNTGYARVMAQLDQLHASGSFSPDGSAVLLTFSGRHAVLAEPGKEERLYFTHAKLLRSAVMSPDGQFLLSASDDRSARLWDKNGKQLVVFTHRKAVFSAIFSPDGKAILTTADDNSAHLWNLQGQELAKFSHKRPLFSAVFSPDGNRILTASDDNTARLWNREGELLSTYRHERSVFSAVFSPDGEKVLTASDDNTARLWNLEGNQLTALPHNRSVRSAVFSPDGQQMLTASWDKTARLWDLSGKMQVEFRHSSWVYTATFSPDGSRILTTADERAAHLWDTSGKHLARLEHEELVTSATFSPDGQKIISSSRDQVSRFWNLKGDKVGELICPC